MKNILCLLILLSIGKIAFSQFNEVNVSNDGNVILEDSALKAIFSKDNGALVELINKSTGWHIQNRKELGISFNMVVPIPKKRNNSVYGIKQKLSSFKLSEDKKSVVFIWNKVKSEYGGNLNILLEATVQLSFNGLNFNMKVQNNSSDTIEALSYPVIGDLSNPNPINPERLECMNVGYAGLGKSSLWPTFSNGRGYYGDNYPTMNFTGPQLFMMVGTDRQGLYMECHDTSFKEMISWTFELKPGWSTSYMAGCNGTGIVPKESEIGGKQVRIECNVWHFPYIKPNETYTLSPIVFNPYQGGWQKGVDNYKAWRKTWFHHPRTPQWAAQVHSWQQLQINSPEDEPMIKYKDIVAYGRECAQNHISAIQLVGWNIGGQDDNYPLHDTDPRLGTKEELKEAIRQVEAMGVHIILFNKYTWSDQTTPWFQKELVKYAVKDPYGLYHVSAGDQYFTPMQLNDLNTHRLIPMCQLSKNWRAIANKEFQKVVDLGSAGMLYDENQHHGGTNYCFDKTHGHRVPAMVFAGDVPLVKGFYEISAKKNQDYLYCGEANYDIENQYYQVAYFRFDATNHIPVKRYIDPQGLMMVAVTGFNDRLTLNGCLKYRYIISYEPYNFKGHVTDFPLTLEYGKKIDELRSNYKEFLWDGDFLDTMNAKVMAGNQNFTSYTVFKDLHTNKYGVVITNNDLKNKIDVTVSLDNGVTDLEYVTPENLTPQSYAGKITIPAQSVVFLYEKK
jgi:hypothetical protein